MNRMVDEHGGRWFIIFGSMGKLWLSVLVLGKRLVGQMFEQCFTHNSIEILSHSFYCIPS